MYNIHKTTLIGLICIQFISKLGKKCYHKEGPLAHFVIQFQYRIKWIYYLRGKNMKKKLILVLVLFTSLPLLLFSLYSIVTNEKELQQNANQISMDNVKAVQYEISSMINQNFDLLRVLNQNQVFHNEAIKTNDAKALLVAAAKVHPEATLVYTDAAGQQKVRSDNSALSSLADRAYLKKAVETGKPVVSEILVSKSNGHNIIALCIPILNESQKVIATLNNTIDLSSLSAYVTKLSNNGNTAFIVDATGKVLAHPDPANLQKDSSQAKYVQEGLKGNSGTEIVTEGGKKMFVSYTYDAQTGWLIGNGQDYAAVMAQSSKIIRNSILILVITLAIAVVVGYYFSSRITKPIVQLTELAKVAANGDLTLQVSIKDKNEIGQLAKSINTMVLSLRSTVNGVLVSAESLSAAALQISATTEEIAKGSTNQANDAQTMSELFNELSLAINSVAVSAEQAAELSNSTLDIAQDGGKVVRASIDGMKQVYDQMSILEGDSNKIGQIIEVIDEIAEQTNLLALNAAIEAARAGEQGRGFAVVADEVRKLAERSSEATKQINGIIKGMQENTRKSVNAVGEGVVSSSKTGEAFENIVQVVNDSAQKVTEIAAASEEQAAQSSEVLASIESISAATEEAAASSQETAATAQSLVKLAKELKQSVSIFRVN
jgi:methyl-accepting chemotaxis protein